MRGRLCAGKREITLLPDGEVMKRPFTVRRGKTIFSAEPGLLISFADSSMELAVAVAPDGSTMSLSDNVYDGFSTAYRRVK